jgi:hypothetical protein
MPVQRYKPEQIGAWSQPGCRALILHSYSLQCSVHEANYSTLFSCRYHWLLRVAGAVSRTKMKLHDSFRGESVERG